MMDPFINDKQTIDKGGDLYFNLGDVSEDILKDGKNHSKTDFHWMAI